MLLQSHRADVPSARVRFARAAAAQGRPLRLYGILDAEACVRTGVDLLAMGLALGQAGVQILQYRDKVADEATYLANARRLRRAIPAGALLLLNDRADLVEAAGCDGVHVGQADVSVSEARRMAGPDRVVGVSTHSADQALLANSADVDYVAIGPVFQTKSKRNAEPAVGLCGVQAARALVSCPLVAIGGIDLEQARSVRLAGADLIAVISALLPSPDSTAIVARAQDFLSVLK